MSAQPQPVDLNDEFAPVDVNAQVGGGYVGPANQSYVATTKDDPKAVRANLLPGVKPKPVDLDQEFPGQAPPAPAVVAAPATPASVISMFGGHALKSGSDMLNLLSTGVQPGAAVASMIDPTIRDIYDLRTSTALAMPWLTKNAPPVANALSSLSQWQNAKPQNNAEQVAATAGDYAPALAGGGEGLVARGAPFALSTLGSLGARYGARTMGFTPDQQETAANIGGIVGGVSTLLPSAARAATPYLSAFSQGAADRAAASNIMTSASDAPSALSALFDHNPPLPSSPATLGDVTGDLGLVQASRAAATRNPGDYANITAGQTAARHDALAALSPGADTLAVPGALNASTDALTGVHNAAVADATSSAQDAAHTAVGAPNPADVNGQAIRDAISAAEGKSKAIHSALYNSVDPDRTMVLPADQMNDLSKTITGIGADRSNIGQAATSAERDMIAKGSSIGPATTMGDLMAYKAALNENIVQASARGDNVAAGRLQRVRGALNDAIDNLGATNAAQSGINAPNANVSATIGTASPAQAAAAQSGNGGVAGEGLAGTGTAQTGGGGTGMVEGGQAGRPVGNQDVQGKISSDLRPINLGKQVIGYTSPSGENMTVTQARSWSPSSSAASTAPVPQAASPEDITSAVARMRQADAAFAEHAQTFGGKVGNAIATNGYAGQYTGAAGSVPGQFFKDGPTGAQAMATLAKAAPDAVDAVHDYALGTLRDSAMGDNGLIDPAKLARWKTKYASALSAMPPETIAGLDNAATATQAVGDAEVARTAALKANNTAAVAKISGMTTPQELSGYIGSVIGTPGGEAQINNLLGKIGGNQAARDGLKQAVTDYISQRFISNTEASTSGTNKISADKFQTFLKTARPALAKIFNPDEMENLNAIGADIQQSQRTLNATKLAGQSNTRQDQLLTPDDQSIRQTALNATGAVMGSALGYMLHHGAGGVAEGALAGGAVSQAGQFLAALRAKGIANINDIVDRAVLDSNFARTLLAKTTSAPTVSNPAGQAILRALAVPVVVARRPAQGQSSPTNALSGVTP